MALELAQAAAQRVVWQLAFVHTCCRRAALAPTLRNCGPRSHRCRRRRGRIADWANVRVGWDVHAPTLRECDPERLKLRPMLLKYVRLQQVCALKHAPARAAAAVRAAAEWAR
eukprot:305424-Chlamydomonas_euryale.AAC.1